MVVDDGGIIFPDSKDPAILPISLPKISLPLCKVPDIEFCGYFKSGTHWKSGYYQQEIQGKKFCGRI